jgi:hypothetical protein
MQTEYKPGIVSRFCRPNGAPTREPSEGLKDVLRRLSEVDEMQQLVTGARAQNRSVVIEVFHAKGDYPLLIHTTATPRKNRA